MHDVYEQQSELEEREEEIASWAHGAGWLWQEAARTPRGHVVVTAIIVGHCSET